MSGAMQGLQAGTKASYLTQLHEDIDDAQEVGGRQGCTCVTTGHVVFIQRALPLA